MGDDMTIGRTGLVPAERNPVNVGKDRKRWFYVGRKMCNFVDSERGGASIRIPTKLLQRALCRMELELGKQRKMRKPKRRSEPR